MEGEVMNAWRNAKKTAHWERERIVEIPFSDYGRARKVFSNVCSSE